MLWSWYYRNESMSYKIRHPWEFFNVSFPSRLLFMIWIQKRLGLGQIGTISKHAEAHIQAHTSMHEQKLDPHQPSSTSLIFPLSWIKKTYTGRTVYTSCPVSYILLSPLYSNTSDMFLASRASVRYVLTHKWRCFCSDVIRGKWGNKEGGTTPVVGNLIPPVAIWQLKTITAWLFRKTAARQKGCRLVRRSWCKVAFSRSLQTGG